MQIGEFQVLAELGRGAMAVVYHARSLRTGLDVALKLLPPGRNPRQQERFRREAEALMVLNHPNIVGVHGFGEFNGSLYMAMELIPGEGLDERIERLGPLPVGYAVELFVPLAKALGHAHERRILHRDLKPANVLISAAGKPYLADFGLAKDADSQGVDLTQEGALVGTPGFWSPEQAIADHGNVGPATDVYGLGATLYAALTGKAPIEGDNLPELVIAVQDTVPQAPHVRRPEIPRALSAVCMRCLHKKPARRFSSGGALAKALTESLRTRAKQRVSRRGLALQGLLVLGLTAGAAAWITRGGSAEQTPESSEAPPPVDPVEAEAPSAAQLLAQGKAAIEAKDGEAARAAFSAALELDPDDPLALIGMGDVALMRDDSYRAIDYLSAGLLILPRDSKALASRGIAYARIEEWDDARRDLELSLSIEPNDPWAQRNMGAVLGNRGEPEAAIKHLNRAIELYPEGDEGQGQAFFNRGVAYFQLKEFAKAEPDVRAALAIDPETEGANYLLAVCAFRTGRWAEAVEHFTAALEALPPTDPRYAIALEKRTEARENLAREAR